MSIVLAALGVIAFGLLVALVLVVRKFHHVQAQYVGITSAETEIVRLKAEAANTIALARTESAAAIDQQKSEATREVERLGKEIDGAQYRDTD